MTAWAIGALATSCSLAEPRSAVPPCQPNAPLACTVIDGYPVGSLSLACGPDGAGCGDAGLLARLALDAREPNHPVPTSVELFAPDMARVCGAVLCTFSSQRSIVVFTFVDGQHSATGYECAGVAPCVGTLTWAALTTPSRSPLRNVPTHIR